MATAFHDLTTFLTAIFQPIRANSLQLRAGICFALYRQNLLFSGFSSAEEHAQAPPRPSA